MATRDFKIELDDVSFFQGMIGTLAGTLEEVVGLEDAASFVGVVGGKIGDDLASQYVSELQGQPPSAEMLGTILVDMKSRIGGTFRIETFDEDGIILVNSRCPFAEQVKGRPSLCMMTTNVFGRIVATANMGDCPTLMLNAPVPAAEKVLLKAGLTKDDIDVWEINEAFSVVAERFIRKLGLDREKVNINGGAMALGHPIGATGSILVGTALDELERQGGRYALITMCAAGGMAPAIIIERV